MKTISLIKRFILGTFYGAFVWIAFCAILDGLWCWADAYLPDESWGMNLVRNVFWFSAVAVVAGASGYSLWTKRVGRAVGQLLLSLVTFGVASVLLAVVNVFTFEVALEHRGPDKGWWSVGPNEQVPFAVEYRSLHPFLAAGLALSHRRYLGKICPSGKFEQGGIAPLKPQHH